MFEKKPRCVWKKRRAIGECVRLRACSHLGAFACVSWRNKRIAYWRSHCIYTGFRMGSHIFLSPKNLLVHNGVQNGVQNRVQIRGPKGGQLFCQHPQNTCNLYANVPIKSIYLSVCLSVCLSILSFTEIQIVCTSIYDFVQQLLCFVFIPAYIRIK